MNNYITIFEKLLDLINWNTLKKSAYKLDINYNIASNHLKTHLYFHLAKLDSLRDIGDFMQSDFKLKELIKSVSLGMLSNYNNHIDYNVYIPILNELISNTLEQLPISEKIKKFGTIKLIRSEERVGKECRSRWSPYH